MSDTDDDISTMIEDCEKRESKLSDWERAFIDSCSYKLAHGRSLTAPMEKTLEEIWEKVT